MTFQRVLILLSVVAFILLCIFGAGFLNDKPVDPEVLWGTLGTGLALFAGGHL